MVTSDRLIRTLITDKTWTPRSCVADTTLSDLNLEWPTALTVDPLRQTLLVLDSDVVYRIDVAAELARIEVGAPTGCDSLISSTNDTLSAVRLHSAKALAVGDDGTLLVVESNGKKLNQVRAFGRDGRPTLIAGKTSKCDCDRRNCPCDNEGQVLARDAHLHQPIAIVVDAAGTLHIADQANFKIKSMHPMRPSWDAHERLYDIVSADTNEVYLFNGFGQHVATQSLLSGQFVYNFTYHIDNSYGRLLQVIGGGGHRLYFVRRSNTEIQIETSHAVKTTLRLGNFDQMLETVALPDGGFIRLDHDAGKGLLLSKVDADGRAWFYDYNADGRADRLVTPAGDTYRVSESVVGQHLVSRVTRNGKFFSEFVVSPSELGAIGASNRRVLVVDGGFYVDANGYRSQFDGSEHPLLAPHETTLLKRKASLPALNEPQRRELTSRLEWRSFVRREGKGASKRVAQVNGRNALTVEFDRRERMDNLTDHADHKLLVVHYNEAGQIVEFEPSVADLASMNISYDAHGRTKRLAWGDRRAAFVYDQQSRLTDATAGPDGNLLPRKYAYELESSHWPSTVQVPSGLEYSVVYDDRGGLSEITTPSGDDHKFGFVHDFGRSILLRSVPFAAEPFVFALDDQQRPSEFVSPMGLRRASYQRDSLGRLSAVVADGAAVVYSYSDGSDQPVVVESPHFRRETIRQGPLPVSVSERRMAGDDESLVTAAHFAYEYDDLLRLSAVHASFDGSATLEPARFAYDSNTGRLSRVKSYNLLYDGAKTRLMGDNNVVLERMYGAHRELVQLRLVIHGNKVMEQTAHYDSAGRVEGVERTVAGEQRPPQVRTYNVDGTLGQLNVGDQAHRWTLHYDLDGRLKAVNDNKLQLINGAPVDMEKLKFETDASGAVVRRGDEWFEYDAFGRLRRISQKDATNVTYVYDDSDRLIGQKRRDGVWTRFFYALPHRPNLLTHATTGETITAFYYDDEDRLFAMQRAGTHYMIVADVDGTPSFVFDGNGALVKEVLRDPLGRELARHSDGCVSPNSLLAPVDPFYPETVDLFRVDSIGQQHLPSDVVSWLRLVGIDMRNVVPLLQLNDRRWLSAEWDVASALCSAERSVLSAAECGVASRIQHFSRFATVGPSLVLPPGLGLGVARRVRWANVASVVGAGVSISTDGTNRAVVHIAKSVDMPTHDALNLLLNESFFVGAQLAALDAAAPAGSRAIVERHFWKKSAEQSVQDLTSLGIVSETATLTSLLNISVGDSQVTIVGPRSRTIIHYGDNMEALRRRLVKEETKGVERRVWAREADLVERKQPTRTPWSESQRQQLLADGFVSDFAPVFRPPPADSGVVASLSDLTFWEFKSTKR
uniref:Tox-GHH domain-containing protein n=1 Tax=Plectus sambesii TaxID=2011161 RepID=A0A914UIF6_9BILA